MNTNASSDLLLTLATLDLSSSQVYPAFVVGTLAYLTIAFCNLFLLTVIVTIKKLRKPMYFLLLNLPIGDTIGATAFYPQFFSFIVTGNKMISYPACVTQAFFLHVYGTGNLLVLSAMSYDRYIAICCPLRYNAIMNPNNLIIIITSIWLINLSLILTLILLLVRFKVCRTNVVDLYCNNPSLLKLVCEDTAVNNYYGVAVIIFCQGGSLLIIMYTYAQILRTCVMTNQTDAKKKAIQTCGTHLLVYLILQISTMVTLTAHRIESISSTTRKALGVLVLLFPPFLDPIIYGLKTAEIKDSIIMLLKRKLSITKL